MLEARTTAAKIEIELESTTALRSFKRKKQLGFF